MRNSGWSLVVISAVLFVFGSTIGGGFDGDGYSELVIGVPEDDVDGVVDAGAVNVLFGSGSGLTTTDDQLWHQDTFSIVGDPYAWEKFGFSLAIGDFNGDRFADVAIGIPDNRLVWDSDPIGAVQVLYGAPSGLGFAGNQLWSQDSPFVLDVGEENEFFGAELAIGDFDADGFDDLAVGVEGQDHDTVINAGAVHIFYGSAAGIDPTDDWFFHQSTTGMADIGETAEFFGAELAAGDFDGNGYYDLAVGVIQEDIGAAFDAGAVHVVLGTMNGLAVPGNSLWHQDVPGMANAAEEDDLFGRSLAAGDFDRDGFDDLAVGIRYEDNGAIVDSGAVHVIYGASGGLNVAGNWFFHQNTPGMIDETETEDEFGDALAVGDFDGDGYDDLAIGVNREDIGPDIDCGVVNVVHGSPSGLVVDGNQFWHRDTMGVEGSRESGDAFGFALAALPRSGLFFDGFETGNANRWSTINP